MNGAIFLCQTTTDQIFVFSVENTVSNLEGSVSLLKKKKKVKTKTWQLFKKMKYLLD